MIQEQTRKKILFWFWTVLTVPFALILFLLALVWLFAKIPSFAELEHPDNKLATQIISEDGRVLTTFHIENRTYVPYEDLSPYLVNATVATEDARFYKHSGIDIQSLWRVAVKTLLMHDSSQGGGSTVTQQLAKTLYPRREVRCKIPGWSGMVMVWTKLKEWITAVKLERNYTKNEIMDMYLNSIFFGSSAYGIRAASETFFSKQPADLKAEEAAMLVGMVNKPTRYNPALHPEAALQRRNFVLSRMAGAKFISKEQCDSLQALPITLNYQVQDHNAGLAPYFRDMLRRDMNASRPKRSRYRNPEEFTADSLRWEEDGLYGWLEKNPKADGSQYNLDKDGLKIYTTINSRMQKYAEEAVAEYLGTNLQKAFDQEQKQWKRNPPFSNDTETDVADMLMAQARRWSDRYRNGKKEGLSDREILAQFSVPTDMRVFAWNDAGYVDRKMSPDDSIRYYKSILRCAFMAMEPITGHVKAYVGGPNYRYFKYDNVSQGKRQVGSTIKPFLYTLAMQEGMSPCDKVVNAPQTFINYDGTDWTPRSTDKEEWIGRTVTLKWGLTNSSNNISAYLMKQFGPTAMAQMMHKMGISSHLDEVYSLCVGPADLNVREMVAAYNTFPSKGVYITPLFVSRIEDNQGNLISEFTNRKREAISERTAALMVNLMQGVIDEGTGRRLRFRYNLECDIAGKTGTTNDNSDGWFIGYTPTITAGIWVGCEDRQVHFESMALGQGANSALPIWGIFMQKCMNDSATGVSPTDRFVAPAGISFNLSCSGGDIEDEAPADTGSEENYYFN